MYRASLPSYVGAVPLLHLWQQWCFPGPPKKIFGRQDRHSGGDINGLSPLPPPHTIPQNSGKTMVLPVLPPVAALNFPVIIFEHRTVDDFAWFYFAKKQLNRSGGRSKRLRVGKTVIVLPFLFSFLFLQNLVGLLPPLTHASAAPIRN